ncbi:TonB family protein [Pseudoalteromonas ulvae]|nr:TonB family protein [Pseudoalteromonas ulvae]
MIDWLFNQQLVLSGALILLLLVERHLVKQLSARFSYVLWLLIPIVLVANNLPNELKPQTDFVLTKYTVTLAEQGQGQFNLQFSWFLWLVGLVSTLFVSFIAHKQRIAHQPAQLKISQQVPIEVVTSFQVASPLLIGFIKPKLVLPANYESLYTQQQLAMIIEHELCHYRRKDTLFNLFAVSLLCLFWFNPLSWLGYQSYRRMQELACDETVLHNKSPEQRLAYGKAMLLSIENNQHQLYAYTHYTEKRTMLNRLNFIKTRSAHKPFLQIVLLTLVTGLLGGVAVAGDHTNETLAKHTNEIKPIMRIEPKYPPLAARDNIEGSVVLKYDISSAGKVENVSIVGAEPQNVFNHNAKVALEQWQYQPSSAGFKGVLVQLDFALSELSAKRDLIERIKVSNSAH